MTKNGGSATEVHLGKAAIFFAVLAVFGIAAGMAAPLYGFIGILAAIMAVGLTVLHLNNKRLQGR